jgi:ribulose-5-phosphate 4-epimerase/fuculose-1-phosphate aldolase
MSAGKWAASDELLKMFRAVGRASLLLDIQDSHSGNMAVRWIDAAGEERIVITATGSQKGELDRAQICFLSPSETDYGYYKASSETDVHAGILSLPGVRASMHAHVKELVIATLDDSPKPASFPPFIPVDPLGYYHLGGSVPVDWFAVPSGSPEMARTIPERLASSFVTLVWGHGALARGGTLPEALFRLCVANNAGAVVRQMAALGVDIEALRRGILADPAAAFSYPPADYGTGDDARNDFPEEEEILAEFRKAGHRIFESRLSPFHTGSMSARGVEAMLYAPKASMPREIGGPLLKVPLAPGPADDPELALHKAVYAASDFQTVLHCYVPEAEVQARFVYPGEASPADRIIPVDAEGGFQYLVIPVIPPKFDPATLVRLLHEYKVVVVRGGGVWAVGAQSLSEVLHHPSSVREICLYRAGAFTRGLDLRKMEPEKARRW